MAATTVTAVGYGDRFPVSDGGRLVAVTLMLVGGSLFGAVADSGGAWFASSCEPLRVKEETVAERLRRIEAMTGAPEPAVTLPPGRASIRLPRHLPGPARPGPSSPPINDPLVALSFGAAEAPRVRAVRVAPDGVWAGAAQPARRGRRRGAVVSSANCSPVTPVTKCPPG